MKIDKPLIRDISEEFEKEADLWTQHFLSHTPSLETHYKLRIYLMAKEIARLRSYERRYEAVLNDSVKPVRK